MQLETVSFVLERKEEIQEVRKALSEFKNDYPQVKLSKPKFGELSKKMILTFKVESSYVTPLITSFTSHYIKVLATTNKIKKRVLEVTSTFVETLAQHDKGWNELKIEQPKVTVSELDEYAKEGNYEQVVKIAGDLIHYGETIIEKAKDVLEISLQRAIERAIKEAESNPQKAGKSISDLIRIGSYPKLKKYNKIQLMITAGLAAVNLAKKFPKYYYELIKISNNAHLNHIVNVKAFVALGEIILSAPEKHSVELKAAVKMINIRWIEIANDVEYKSMTDSERKIFSEFLDLLKKERSKS
jgi:hypothetical protein